MPLELTGDINCVADLRPALCTADSGIELNQTIQHFREKWATKTGQATENCSLEAKWHHIEHSFNHTALSFTFICFGSRILSYRTEITDGSISKFQWVERFCSMVTELNWKDKFQHKYRSVKLNTSCRYTVLILHCLQKKSVAPSNKFLELNFTGKQLRIQPLVVSVLPECCWSSHLGEILSIYISIITFLKIKKQGWSLWSLLACCRYDDSRGQKWLVT